MLKFCDLNSVLWLFPVLLKGISAGRYVDLALAYSQGVGQTLGII